MCDKFLFRFVHNEVPFSSSARFPLMVFRDIDEERWSAACVCASFGRWKRKHINWWGFPLLVCLVASVFVVCRDVVVAFGVWCDLFFGCSCCFVFVECMFANFLVCVSCVVG